MGIGLLLSSLVIGCASEPRRPRDATSFGCFIGLAVTHPASVRWLAGTANGALFARLDAAGRPIRDELVRSNASRFRHETQDVFLFLVDVEPGRYAPVAVQYSGEYSTGTTYFSQSAIDELAVTVGGDDGLVGFIGELVVEKSEDWDTADETQRYYHQEIGRPDRNALVRWLSSESHYVGELLEVRRTEALRDEFVRSFLAEVVNDDPVEGLFGRDLSGLAVPERPRCGGAVSRPGTD